MDEPLAKDQEDAADYLVKANLFSDLSRIHLLFGRAFCIFASLFGYFTNIATTVKVRKQVWLL